MNKTYEVARLQDSKLENIVGGGDASICRHFLYGSLSPIEGFVYGVDFIVNPDKDDKHSRLKGISEIAGDAFTIALIIGAYEGIKYGVNKIKSKGKK